MIFKPSKQRFNKKKIYGFDIETYGKYNKFLVASVWGDDYKRVYHSINEFLDDIKTKRFHDSIISMTNAGFDFFGVLYGMPGFSFCFRGSDLIMAKTFIYNNKFNRFSNRKRNSITFLDTMNYAKLSVERLGGIIGIPKLEKPEFLGRKIPRSSRDYDVLVRYNLNDSKISCKGLQFLYDTFEKIGASPRLTIASTSMSLYKNKYLDKAYFTHDVDTLLEIFKGYYGGRCEAFARGKFNNYNYYDFNSLYPFVMQFSYPDPNSLRIKHENSDRHILSYEGMSKVRVSCPLNMEYPLLPLRHNEKLLFPTGTFEGYYTHLELRKAVTLGYTILKVYKTFYYTRMTYPFKAFVEDMYNLRLKYKKEGSPMEYVVKILMNSLYGKFGQKFLAKDNVVYNDLDPYEFRKYRKWEIIGDYIRVVEDRPPSAFCIPIWAAYVTAYARLHLHDHILLSRPLYVDTDSLITRKEFISSNDLGKLKLEMRVKQGFIVKPKFYGLIGDDNAETAKIKGIGKKLVYGDFSKIARNPTVSYQKFMKFRESLRRNRMPNEVITVQKHLDLEDNKRKWDGEFNKKLQFSSPLEIRG